ncbi:unnamed protein product [Cuscuta epithymum]|uniref:Uncharacterized protein n=1 Tax=Cuscuta epithymum TaxID=186058 RepID=A0AAV0EWE0_9ASTE|nr:unnamed protein product [Cuscuta epithymum]
MIQLFGGLRKCISQGIISLQPKLRPGIFSSWWVIPSLTPIPRRKTFTENLGNVLQSDAEDVDPTRIIGEVMELVSDLKRKNFVPRMEEEDSWKKMVVFVNGIPDSLTPMLEAIHDRVVVSNLIEIKCFYADMVMRRSIEITRRLKWIYSLPYVVIEIVVDNCPTTSMVALNLLLWSRLMMK